MFIKINELNENDITIDVRTVSEFNNFTIFKYNIPIINEAQHKRIKKFYPTAIPIILYALIKNKETIKKDLLKVSNHGKRKIIVGCSRGRLRSPIMCLYARMLGIKCKVLYRGIKRFKNNNVT